jgi:hypothetical protein
MKCKWEECDQGEFTESKPWQEFCCTRCRSAWHYREKLRAEVREAEAASVGVDLAALAPEPLVVKRRKIIAVEAERR